jgi:hypothetical protein
MAVGLGIAIGFALALGRLGLWLTPWRPRSPRAKLIVLLTTIMISVGPALAMPHVTAALLLWLGVAAGFGLSTPIVLPLAHRLFKLKAFQPLAQDPRP